MKLTKILFLSLAASLCIACGNEEDAAVPYFSIEGNPTSLSVTSAGIEYDLSKAQKYIVRSNRPWKIVMQEANNWLQVFPMEGEGDGIIRVSAVANATFVERVVNVAFVAGGEELPILFRVEQAASVPMITVVGSEKGMVIARDGGQVKVPVTANIQWRYSLSEDSDWLKVDEVTKNSLTFSAQKNMEGKLNSAVLTLTGVEHPNVTTTVLITQTGALLYEDFSWLNYGSEIHYNTTGETAITKWSSTELARGWTSRSTWCYARTGFIKLGKTSYGGDVVSPKLLSIIGTPDITVSFKATAYISQGGAKDENRVYVGVLGGGTLEGATNIRYDGIVMPFVGFSIDNYPNSSKLENGESYDVWADDIAKRSITVKGATANTQLVFLGGAYDADLGSIASGKNRIFLDEVTVVEKE